jgi:tetratricopeptide (TPR) repeat protein
MDLDDRLRLLEGCHDWQGLVDALEEAIAAEQELAARARLHLRLARVLAGPLMQGARALKHFQDAFKLDASLTDALSEARAVYWQLGKLPMVRRLLELQIQRASTQAEAAQLLVELGDVATDQGDLVAASQSYERAVEIAGADAVEANERLRDLRVEEANWRARVREIQESVARAAPAERANALVRAARVARRLAPNDAEALLREAYAADPTRDDAATLYEGMLVAQSREESIVQTQRGLLQSISDPNRQADLALRFGSRWGYRHKKPQIAAQFVEETLRHQPDNEAAFAFLRDVYGTHLGDWSKVVGLADELGSRVGAPHAAFFLANAAAVAQELGDVERARGYYARLAEVAPQHTALARNRNVAGDLPALNHSGGTPGSGNGAHMTAQRPEISESDVDGTASNVRSVPPAGAQAELEPVYSDRPAAVSNAAVSNAAVSNAAVSDADATERSSYASERPAAPASTPPAAASASPAPASVPPSAPPAAGAAAERPPSTPPEPKQVSAAGIAELRDQLAKQESQNRVHELVKTLVALGDAVPDPVERVQLYARAADLYANKFMNQAEAVKANEKIFALDPGNASARDYLRQMYEKRRDWEKLVRLRQAEAAGLASEAERAALFKEIALLATERIKKPAICIALWEEVLSNDGSDSDALNELSKLYERDRAYDKLADVLQRLSDNAEGAERIALLTKLGQVVGDRLKDEDRAIEVYRALVALEPDNRRAQEQLKKRYVALGRWDDLDDFYAVSGRWDEFIRVLESSEARAESVPERIRMLQKIADLWEKQLKKPDRAARAYEKILSLDATNRDAATRLIPIYSSSNNAKGLSSVLEVKLGDAEDDVERLEILSQLVEIYEARLKDPARAYERSRAAFVLAPSDDVRQAEVERLAAVTGDWPSLIDSYRVAIRQSEQAGDGAAALRLRLGRVHVEQMGNVDEALTEYRAVADAQPDNLDALKALEKLYLQTERYAELLDIYARRSSLAETPEESREIALEIAQLHETKLGDRQAAIDSYQTVLVHDALDQRALAALDRLYREAGEWRRYAEIIERRLELDVGEEQVLDLKFRLAEAQRQHLGETENALATYREVLTLSPTHEGARMALEGWLSEPELRAASAQVLEAIYLVLGDWDHLIQVSEILAQTADEVDRQVELYAKIAEIAEQRLGDSTRAFEAQSKALIIDPSHEGTAAELERLAAASDQWQRLGQLYHEVADRLGPSELSRSYRLRAARNEERLGNIAGAAENYERLLELDPSDPEALAALDALYRNAGRWEDLIGVFRRRIDLSESEEESIGVYGQLASVYEEKLGRPEDAIQAYREVLAIDPTSDSALSALDGLYARGEAWRELADNLETRLKLADTEEKQRTLMLRLADLFERRLDQVERAIDTYRDVLERDPYDQNALGALERLSKDGRHELGIAEILEPLYQQQGDYEKLVNVYEVQARHADDSGRKVELLHRIASLHEDVANNVERAFATYARALAIEPLDETTVEGLDRLARSGGRFAQLADVYEELAASQRDTELVAHLYGAAARVVQNEVGDVPRAIGLFNKVLEVAPRDLSAVEALESLYLSAERFAELSQILQRKSKVLDEVPLQKAALFEAARIEEEVLNRPEAAIQVYEAVLELEPEELRALDSLIKLYLELSRWEELLATQLKKVDLVQGADEKKAIYYQMGAVYERELEDVPRAIDTYQKVLELDPDDLPALGRLDVLYQTAENWAELLTVLAHEAELTADPAEAVSYQYRIAELYEKRLNDLDRAVELYRDVLNVQADHPPTLRALEGIKDSAGPRALMAAQALEPVYDAMAEWEKLVSALSVQARFTDDPFHRVELLHRVAALYEDRIGDPNGAFEWYARAVKVDSRNEDSLGSFERLASTTGQWPAVAKLYESELDQLGDEPDRLVELGLRVAQVHEVQLGDIDAAVAQYRRVLEVEPENQGAIRALARLFAKAERYAELADILKREAAIGHTPDEILDCKYRLGQVYQNHLSDFDQAVATYEEVLGSAPEHVLARSALEELFAQGKKRNEIARVLGPLYEAGGEWERLVQVHEAQLTELTAADERLELYHRIASDYEERLANPTQAFGVLARALQEAPLDERVQTEIERLAPGFEGGWEELANTYADVMSLEGAGPVVQAHIGRHLARVFEEELVDVEKAEETYRYVLTVSPGEQFALENLDRIYLGLEQWAELAGILEQRAATAEDPARKIELYQRLGRVYEEHLDQTEPALRAYRLIFDELEPSDSEATSALVRIYQKREEWEKLEEVYKRQLESALGDVEQAEIRAKLAALASDHLGRDDEAIEGWKRVLDLRGEDSEALDALARLYERSSQWAELADLLERLYDVAEDDEARVNALARRARLFTESLARHEEALDAWQRVLDIDFANIAALRSINKLRRSKGEHAELVLALHQYVDRAADRIDSEELREVFRELAKLYSQVLQQPEDAADAWRRLLEVDGTDLEAMGELESIYRASGSWPEVVDIKLRRATVLPNPPEKIAQLLEAAAIWRDEVREYDRAVDVFNRILAIDPTHVFAFQELEKLHTLAERWEPLIECYLARLDATTEKTVRSDLLRRIARVFEKHLGDENQAFDALVTAFSEDFADDETASYLERLAQATQRWGELITTTNEWLQQQTEDKDKIRLCLRLGKWYGENLGRPEYAQPYYAQITQLDPHNAQVLRQMAHIYRQSAQWKKMRDTLDQALNVAVANDDRKVILVDLGQLLEKHMQERDQAVSFFKRALEIDPYYMPAVEALERIYDETDEHEELAGILNRKVKALREPEEIAGVQQRLGELYETKLENWEKAGDMYRAVVSYNPGSLPALRGLTRVYENSQNWGDLVDVLERQLGVVETERARVDVLMKLAQIQEEQFLKADIAAQKLERVLELDPSVVPAYEALERCYRRLKQWPEFITTCERHISEVTDVGTKADLHEQIARIYADELEDLDRAIDAYQNIIDLDDTRLPALEALARLHERQGDTARSIDVMIRIADLTADGSQRVEMYYRIGKALDEKLSDRAQARERFEMALDLDPKHLPTLSALRAIATEDADWDSVARYLEEEQKYTESPRAKSRLLVELGKVQDQMLGERALAVSAYERAIASDRENEDAAMPLVEEYVATERWNEAAPLAEMLVKKSKARDKSEQHSLNRLLGKIQEARKNYADALKAYQAAHALDVTDPETVRGLASVTFELGDWPSALTNYQKVLTGLGEGDVEERTEVYHRLGRVKQAQGQNKQAINNFEKALALDPNHRKTLDSLVDIYTAEQDWPQVAEHKRRILEQIYDDEERLQLLVSIADVWGEKQKDAAKAIEALEEARGIRPQDHIILHKLLAFYQESGDWRQMVDTLAAISEIEQEPAKKARYSYTMAQLYRDKIQDMERAVELFNEALDLAPDFLEAFERINKILTVERNWKQLERQYRKMIHRITGKGKTDLEFNLWHQLGLVYRDRLSNVQPALEAFRMASSLRPEDSQERVILSELHEMAEQFDEAITEQRVLLEQKPLSVSPYRALYRLYSKKNATDEAWCAAGALVFMQQATTEERAFYERYRVKGMPQVKGRLTNEVWSKHLIHNEENVYISKMFEMITPAALQAKIAMLKAKRQLPDLDKRLLQDPKNSTVTFAKTFFWAASILGVHAPELYVRSDIPGSVVAVPMLPPASLAGQTVLTGFQPQELTFICGKHLASYRGEHYIRTLFPTQAELTIMLFAGVMLSAPNTPMPPDMAQQIRMTAQELGRFIQPVQLEGLRTVVKRFIDEGAKANIKRWNFAVEMTAARAGFALCGDLEICKKVLSSEQTRPGEPTAAEKMQGLLAYSVSEDYAKVRQALGVAITNG